MPILSKNPFYESRFRDALFVIKAGGQVIANKDALPSLIANIREFTMNGINVLLIYGGGKPIDDTLEAQGIEPKKHNGRRITSAEDMKVIQSVLAGDLSFRVYQAIAANSFSGLCFNAVPSDWMNVKLRPKEPVDFGFVGDIHGVNKGPIQRLFKSGANFIACPCIAADENGAPVNINADTVATELAIGLKAHKLIFLSDVDGVKIGDEVATILTEGQIPGLITDGIATSGMRVKLENCARALKAGVRRIHMINGTRPGALMEEIFTSGGTGTMLIKDSERKVYENEIKYQNARKSA